MPTEHHRRDTRWCFPSHGGPRTSPRGALQLQATRCHLRGYPLESDAFDFSIQGGAFQGEGTLYQGAMTFLWYDKEAKLRAARISKLGRVLYEVVAS